MVEIFFFFTFSHVNIIKYTFILQIYNGSYSFDCGPTTLRSPFESGQTNTLN